MAVSVLVVFSGAGPWIGREILAGFQQQFNTTRQALPTLLGTHWWQRARPAATIDRINIYEASRLAMKMAIGQLQPAADFVLVDAVPLDLSVPQEPLIQGDERCHAIAAASIPAKVYRDRMMCEWDRFYPEYGLANHKGYHAPSTWPRSGVWARRRCIASVSRPSGSTLFIRRWHGRNRWRCSPRFEPDPHE